MRGPLARKHGEEHYGRLDSRSERGHSSRTSELGFMIVGWGGGCH